MSHTSPCGPVIGVSERLELAEGDRLDLLLREAPRLGIKHLRLTVPAGRFDVSGAFRKAVRRLPGEMDVVLALPSGTADALPQLDHGDGLSGVAFIERPLPPVLTSANIEAFSAWCEAAREAGWSPIVRTSADSLQRLLKRLDRLDLLNPLDAVVCDVSAGISRRTLAGLNERLETEHPGTKLWLCDAAFVPDRARGREALFALTEALGLRAARIYWSPLIDETDGERPRPGLIDPAGKRRMPTRIWEREGLPGLLDLSRRSRAQPSHARNATLITGGAGFVGVNLADRLARDGTAVVIFDNLTRPGTESNLRWLQNRHGNRVRFVLGDIRDRGALAGAMHGVERVYHLAAQVAVTTSMDSPIQDHDINTGGTLNLLEFLRGFRDPPPLIFTSTNKVYGGLEDIPLEQRSGRYEPLDRTIAARGIGESRPLRFCSPYGCSKGASDQYVLDYAETFGLPAAVFRMSCIYGPHQFGNEDQGWVAHFVRQALADEPITIYGDGCQVRDILFIDDLVEALVTGSERIDKIRGSALNIGGGPANAVSLLELIEVLGANLGRDPALRFGPWRASDQRYYVSDIRHAGQMLDWAPRRSVDSGIGRLIHWLADYNGITLEQAAGRMA